MKNHLKKIAAFLKAYPPTNKHSYFVYNSWDDSKRTTTLNGTDFQGAYGSLKYFKYPSRLEERDYVVMHCPDNNAAMNDAKNLISDNDYRRQIIMVGTYNGDYLSVHYIKEVCVFEPDLKLRNFKADEL